jgi:hypothetical protein
MTDLTIRLNDTFITTQLSDFEIESFRNNKIDSVGIIILPINAKTNTALSFELSFKHKSLIKKISSFEGELCEKTRKYTLKINGEMKVKLRSGVVDRLNEEDGGYVFKLACITCDNVRAALDGHEEYNAYEAVLTDLYTVSDFTFS